MSGFSKKTWGLFLVNLGLLLALCVFYWFLYSEIRTMGKAIADASAEIALLQEKEREFDASSASLKKYSEEVQNLKDAFLAEENFVDFIKLVEGLAKKAGVEFKAVNASLPVIEGELARLSFEIKGIDAGLVRFFELLDKMQYSGIIDQMDWSMQGKGGETVKVTASYAVFNYIK